MKTIYCEIEVRAGYSALKEITAKAEEGWRVVLLRVGYSQYENIDTARRLDIYLLEKSVQVINYNPHRLELEKE